jgi:hypothetical protein
MAGLVEPVAGDSTADGSSEPHPVATIVAATSTKQIPVLIISPASRKRAMLARLKARYKDSR